jgi:hypothetical protein
MRALAFGDPVEARELGEVLGDVVGPLRDAGFLVEEGGDALRARLRVRALPGGGYCVADADGPWRPLDAQLADTARPEPRVASLLALAAGNGAVAIALAPHAERVVAVERDAHAAVLARIGAGLSGAGNVEVRDEEPDPAEVFGRVVASLASPAAGAEPVAELLRASWSRLAPGAHAFVAADLPVRDAATRHDVLGKNAQETGAQTVVLESPIDLEELCANAAMATHADLGRPSQGIAQALFALRAGYARQGATQAYRTIYVLERCDPGCGWVRVQRLA